MSRGRAWSSRASGRGPKRNRCPPMLPRRRFHDKMMVPAIFRHLTRRSRAMSLELLRRLRAVSHPLLLVAWALSGSVTLLALAGAGPSPVRAERSVDGEEELLPIGPTPEE